ncbi:GTP cyclohydrolase I [Planctomycetota bacterium]
MSDSKQNNTLQLIQDLFYQLLILLGEDPLREGLVKTPERVAKALLSMLGGYTMDIKKLVNGAVFKKTGKGIVAALGIVLYSLCEHHMLPFECHINIFYLPKDKEIGISKLARISEMYCLRLQVQERLAREIAEEIFRVIEPEAVGIIIEGKHLCMAARGVKQQKAITQSECFLGTFENDFTLQDSLYKRCNLRRLS